MTRSTPPPIDGLDFAMFAVMATLGLMLISLAGCSSSGTASREVNRIERKQTFVVIPATAEAPAQVVPVTEVTETYEIEESETQRVSGPDWKQVAAVAPVVNQAFSGVPGWGTIVGGVATLAVTTAAGWMARRGEIRDKDQRLERLRVDRDDKSRRVEELARQLPPLAMA